jgi:hypothetical protein
MTLENASTSQKSIQYKVAPMREEDRHWLTISRVDGYVALIGQDEGSTPGNKNYQSHVF